MLVFLLITRGKRMKEILFNRNLILSDMQLISITFLLHILYNLRLHFFITSDRRLYNFLKLKSCFLNLYGLSCKFSLLSARYFTAESPARNRPRQIAKHGNASRRNTPETGSLQIQFPDSRRRRIFRRLRRSTRSA